MRGQLLIVEFTRRRPVTAAGAQTLDENPHELIRSIGGRRFEFTVAEAAAALRQGDVRLQAGESSVGTVDFGGDGRYLRAHRGSDWNDDLLALPVR